MQQRRPITDFNNHSESRDDNGNTPGLLDMPNEILFHLLLRRSVCDIAHTAQAHRLLARVTGSDPSDPDAQIKSDMFWRAIYMRDIRIPILEGDSPCPYFTKSPTVST